MDLLALFHSIRRHKLIVLALLLFIGAGDGYVLFGIAPEYESQAQYVLINPPAAPTDADIARDPSLAKLNTNNPYLRLPNPSVVVDVLAQRVSGDAVRKVLVAQGADRNYQIASTAAIGSGLVVEITGTGHSPDAATTTLTLVSARMKTELHDMQKVDGADDRFLIQAIPINPPTDPIRKVTGTMRSLIAVSAAGLILMFGAVSVAEAVPTRRTRKAKAAAPDKAEASAAVPTSPAPAGNRTTGSSESELTLVLPRMYLSESAGDKPSKE